MNLIKIFHINLLTNEAIFTGWNPTGTEVSLPIKLRVWWSMSTVDRKTLYLYEKTLSLGYNVYLLEKDFSIFWYLQVTDHC